MLHTGLCGVIFASAGEGGLDTNAENYETYNHICSKHLQQLKDIAAQSKKAKCSHGWTRYCLACGDCMNHAIEATKKSPEWGVDVLGDTELLLLNIIFLVMFIRCKFWNYGKVVRIIGIVMILLQLFANVVLICARILWFTDNNNDREIKMRGIRILYRSFFVIPLAFLFFSMFTLLSKKDKFRQIDYKKGLLKRITKTMSGGVK